MPVRIVSAGGGGITLSAASTGSEFTATLPANTGTVVTTASTATVTPAMLTQPLTLGTAQASTSGTSIDFTGIPSWVRRVTVMLNGVSVSGTSIPLFQLGTVSGVEITSYTGVSGLIFGTTAATTSSTAGFPINGNLAANVYSGSIVFTTIGSNIWVAQGCFGNAVGTIQAVTVAGNKTLAGVLDRVRITTVGGTDTFDAGSINIMYEG